MTPDAAPAPTYTRIPVLCLLCGNRSHKWIHEADLIHYPYSPIDGAYIHTCGCKYQRVPADAPIKAQRNNDPERAQHQRRRSSGFHTTTWRTE